MGTCYWCHWGWPKPIKDIYDRAADDLGGYTDPLEFGPAHIVWSDENWDSAQWCLDNFDKYRGDHLENDLAIVRRSLEELLAVPEEMKAPPDNYDGENPANFPPPEHWHVQPKC
jgi:hypothetical protein